MRVILKPGGILFMLTAITIVSCMAFRGNKFVPFPAVAPKVEATSPSRTSPISLIGNGDFSQGLSSGWIFAGGTPTIVQESTGGGLAQYIHMPVIPGPEIWSVRLNQDLNKAVKRGNILVVHGWARSPESLTFHIYLKNKEKVRPRMFLSSQERATPQWHEWSYETTIDHDAVAGEIELMFQFGTKPGNIDLAGITVQNVGTFVAPDQATQPLIP